MKDVSRRNPPSNNSRHSRSKSSKTFGKSPVRRRSQRKGSLRFKDVKGKTVEFVEIGTAPDFPCIEIGFEDKTALHFLFTVDPRLAMEPTYSQWKAGDQRVPQDGRPSGQIWQMGNLVSVIIFPVTWARV